MRKDILALETAKQLLFLLLLRALVIWTSWFTSMSDTGPHGVGGGLSSSALGLQ